eukprot:13007-Heterococcus_DN1.PRE.2
MVEALALLFNESAPSRTEQPWRCSFCDHNNCAQTPSCERCGRGRGLYSLTLSSCIVKTGFYAEQQKQNGSYSSTGSGCTL